MILSDKFLLYRQKGPLLAPLLLLSLLLAACGDVTATQVTGATTLPATTGQIFNTTYAATSTPPGPTQTAIPTTNGTTTETISQVFPELADLRSSASKLTIKDDYSNWTSNRTMEYTLTRQSNNFAGSGTFGETRVSQRPDKYKTVDITIPLSVVQDFLQNLTQTPITAGKYIPVMPVSDSYPDIEYLIDTPAGTLHFYTNSQNEDLNNPSIGNNLPWGFTFANREFVINSPLVSQALTPLKPYLHQEISQQLLDSYETVETPTPTAKANNGASGPVGQVFPVLANSLLEQTSIITITDNYSSIGPGYEAGYSLNRTGNSFTGSAKISAYTTQQNITLNIAIPPDVTKDFLQSLAQIPIEEGKYTPFIQHTDDYPDTSYQVETPYGVLDFYTQSQNKADADSSGFYNLPWGFNFAGRIFTINSPLASQALDKLSPYLHQEVLRQALNGETLKPDPSPTGPMITPTKTP